MGQRRTPPELLREWHRTSPHADGVRFAGPGMEGPRTIDYRAKAEARARRKRVRRQKRHMKGR